MKFNDIKFALKNSAEKVLNLTRENAPTIMVIGGAITGVLAVVEAAKSTLYIDSALENDKEDLARVKKFKEAHDTIENPDVIVDKETAELAEEAKDYGEKQYRHDLFIVYARMGGHFIKTYWKSIILEAMSLTMFGGSHWIMLGRNKQLKTQLASEIATYAALYSAVEKKYGSNVAFDLANGLESEVIDDAIEVDPETGEEKKVEKEVLVLKDKSKLGRFSFIFDSSCSEYMKNKGVHSNLQYVKGLFDEANDLHENYRGITSMNDIFDLVGHERYADAYDYGWEKSDGIDVHPIIISTEIIYVYEANKEGQIVRTPKILCVPNCQYGIRNAMPMKTKLDQVNWCPESRK